MRKFLLFGLTGGIATGKSTVSEMLRRRGVVVIDADVLARDVVAPGEPALAEIVREFGADVLAPDGSLDRKTLGAVVFADPARRKRLEQITHPAIRERFARQLAELMARGFDGLVAFDAAVMIESGNYKNMDRLVVVATDDATQRARLQARDGTDPDATDRKVRSQMPVAEKAALADYVIDNSGDRAATEAEVERVYRALCEERSLAVVLSGDCAHPPRLGALFPIDMGNRGRNELRPIDVLRRLHQRNDDVAFVGHHWRRSGNFLFLYARPDGLEAAAFRGSEVTGLECLVRPYSSLTRADWSIPSNAMVTRGSVTLGSRSNRLILVMLSAEIPAEARVVAQAAPRIEMKWWASSSDVFCTYERSGEAGDVGQVTAAVLRVISQRVPRLQIRGTGRAFGVIRDVLSGRGVRSIVPE